MLMHRYILRTSLTLCRALNEQVKEIWQSDVPVLAQEYSFVMHGLLAVSAHHAASEGELDRKVAFKYYDTALHCFRTSCQAVRPKDGTAIMVFCIMIFIISLRIGSQSEITVSDPVYGFSEPLEVLRTTIKFFRSFRSQVNSIFIQGLIPERKPDMFALSDSVNAALCALEQHNRSLITSEVDRVVFEQAINQLRHFFTLVSSRPMNWNFLIRWLILLPESFDELLKRGNAMALAILAHWCVPIHHAPYRWFMNDWAERIILDVANRLGPEWQPVIRWPINEINAITTETCITSISM